jgi:hypothetical protein
LLFPGPEYNCLMLKKWFILLTTTGLLYAEVFAQHSTVDSVLVPTRDITIIDTTIDYDQLFRDFDSFMDSILSPNSYLLASLSVGKGFYNFESKANSSITTSKKLTYSPTLGYYHKSGLGLTGTGYLVDDGSKFNFFQAAVSPSFDFLKNKSFATGVSFTKFFTKDSLSFYTTPLQNELYGYFTYRKSWIRPMVAFSYGWGSRTDFIRREALIQDLRLRRNGFTYINTEEKIRDFSIIASLRHDFYWLDIFTYKDHIRFTPQLAFTSGTQKFGFNQSSSTYATTIRTATNVLFNTENVYLDDHLEFQPLSLTLFLRGEYSIGKFFIQPQVTLDYYFPAASENFNALFQLNMGFVF